jgi:hypothetical protein
MQLYEILDCRKGDTGNAIKKSYFIKMKKCRSSAYTINRSCKLLKDPTQEVSMILLAIVQSLY